PGACCTRVRVGGVSGTRQDVIMERAVAAQHGAVVRVESLYKSFGERLVLDGVHLSVPSCNIVSIIGQSGGRQATLVRCLNLLERPDRGLIEIEGEAVFAGDRVACADLAKLRQSVGMVFQRFNLFPHLTAIENITLAQIKAAGINAKDATARAAALLRR